MLTKNKRDSRTYNGAMKLIKNEGFNHNYELYDGTFLVYFLTYREDIQNILNEFIGKNINVDVVFQTDQDAEWIVFLTSIKKDEDNLGFDCLAFDAELFRNGIRLLKP